MIRWKVRVLIFYGDFAVLANANSKVLASTSYGGYSASELDLILAMESYQASSQMV